VAADYIARDSVRYSILAAEWPVSSRVQPSAIRGVSRATLTLQSRHYSDHRSVARRLISNPVNSPPEPSIWVLAPFAGSPTKQPTAVFSAPIWLRVFVESKG
jgi:hypothetical protein